MRKWLTDPLLAVRVQVVLGIIFVVAAWPKIVDPPSFAHMIYNYRILPGELVHISALVMPWLELLAGLCLIFGVWTRAARILVTLLLAVFMIAIAWNLIRGNAIDCGCFDVSAANRTYEERIRDMWLVLLRDAGMLLMCAQIWWAERESCRNATAREKFLSET